MGRVVWYEELQVHGRFEGIPICTCEALRLRVRIKGRRRLDLKAAESQCRKEPMVQSFN